MNDATRTGLLRLLGLGVRGRLALVGVDRVREGVRRGAVKFAVVAPDAAANSRDKIVPLLEAKRVAYVEGPSAAELGSVTGRESTAVVGVTDSQLARGIRALVEQGPRERMKGSAEPGRRQV